MINELSFNELLNTLQDTNRKLSFYVDWQKCLSNKDEIKLCLNHLNFLLGVNKNEIKAKIHFLFAEYPKAFSCLNILIAVRYKKEKLFNNQGLVFELKSYFETADKVYDFINESGLIDIFANSKIKDLNDYVFGIEVGLDTNARKNRSGTAMEKLLAKEFAKHNLTFKEQVEVNKFDDLNRCFGKDLKRFDFVIYGNNKTYFIECNFYYTAGSKLNEVARAYQEIAEKFNAFPNYDFIWITDGKGWLDAKSKLSEAYNLVKIYNLSNLQNFINKVKNGNVR